MVELVLNLNPIQRADLLSKGWVPKLKSEKVFDHRGEGGPQKNKVFFEGAPLVNG